MLLRVPWNPWTSFSTIGVPSWYVDASSAVWKSIFYILKSQLIEIQLGHRHLMGFMGL